MELNMMVLKMGTIMKPVIEPGMRLNGITMQPGWERNWADN